MEPNVLVTTTLLAVVVAFLIEIVRKHFPGLNGDLIRGMSVAIGYAAALAWGLDVAGEYGFAGIPTELGYLVTAMVIAGESGIIGSSKNAIRSRDPHSSLYISTREEEIGTVVVNNATEPVQPQPPA